MQCFMHGQARPLIIDICVSDDLISDLIHVHSQVAELNQIQHSKMYSCLAIRSEQLHA